MIRFALSLVLAGLLALSSVASASVDQGARDLIAIVNLSILRNGKLNYRYEENRAVKKIRRDLRGQYRKIHILEGKQATHDRFLALLGAVEADRDVRAIDVIIYLHGQPGVLGFVDTGFYPLDRLRDEILALPGEGNGLRKLRALYSDACYGQSHLTEWLRAGFRVAAGSIGVDANWSLDLRKFMHAWRDGKTFGESIRRANSVRATRLMDRIGHGNSHKETEGAVAFTIDQSP